MQMDADKSREKKKKVLPQIKRAAFFSILFFAGLAGMTRETYSVQSGTVFSNQGPEGGLVAIWNASGVHRDLKNWSTEEFLHLKRVVSREKEPVSGKIAKWEGVLLSDFLDSVLVGLPLENRAQVDLVVLKNSAGQYAYIPRALLSKYPLMLAYQWTFPARSDGSVSPVKVEKGSIHSVVPWSSKPKILNEDLPLETFFLSNVAQVELTNYRDRFGTYFLKRRTDPSAIRGEKIFVQNCVSCHVVQQQSPSGSSHTPLIGRMEIQRSSVDLSSKGHPAGALTARLSDHDQKSIARYLEAHKLENPLTLSQPNQAVEVR